MISMTPKQAAETYVQMKSDKGRLEAAIDGMKEYLADKVGDGIAVGDKVVVYNEPSKRKNFDKDKLRLILMSEAGLSDGVIDSMFERAHTESDVVGFISVVKSENLDKWKQRCSSIAA